MKVYGEHLSKSGAKIIYGTISKILQILQTRRDIDMISQSVV